MVVHSREVPGPSVSQPGLNYLWHSPSWEAQT